MLYLLLQQPKEQIKKANARYRTLDGTCVTDVTRLDIRLVNKNIAKFEGDSWLNPGKHRDGQSYYNVVGCNSKRDIHAW